MLHFLSYIFYIPVLTIALVIGSGILLPLFLVFLYLCIFFNVTGLLFSWCLCSRKGKLGKHQFEENDEDELKKPIK